MKTLLIQLQRGRTPELNIPAAVARVRAVASDLRVKEGDGEAQYVNLSFETADPTALWASIREMLQADPALANIAIVVCQGERGWDDYLLLHHFDSSVPLDQLTASK